jgi:protoporphyrinogen oxidase
MYAEPAREYIERRGGAVQMGAAARLLVTSDGVSGVRAGSEAWRAERVISAVPWFAFPDLVDGNAPAALRGIIDGARRMASSPIVTVNLWFDHPLLDEPFLGLPGRAMQWVFDKRLVTGDDASHLSLVSSGAASMLARTNDELIWTAHDELLQALPDTRTAKLRRATVVREPRATFSLAPGQPARPPTETGVRGLWLAGDWIDTGLPATIESAVRSGHRAADRALM